MDKTTSDALGHQPFNLKAFDKRFNPNSRDLRSGPHRITLKLWLPSASQLSPSLVKLPMHCRIYNPYLRLQRRIVHEIWKIKSFNTLFDMVTFRLFRRVPSSALLFTFGFIVCLFAFLFLFSFNPLGH